MGCVASTSENAENVPSLWMARGLPAVLMLDLSKRNHKHIWKNKGINYVKCFVCWSQINHRPFREKVNLPTKVRPLMLRGVRQVSISKCHGKCGRWSFVDGKTTINRNAFIAVNDLWRKRFEITQVTAYAIDLKHRVCIFHTTLGV